MPARRDDLMGIRIMVEVLDHHRDLGLTVGECHDLLVLAENANDASRETYGSVTADHILRRANKNARSWRNAVSALMRKKALEHAVHDGRKMLGWPGQVAVYRIPELCPHPPHDGRHGQCTYRKDPTPETCHPAGDTRRVTHGVTRSMVAAETCHPGGDSYAANVSPPGSKRVTQQVTPTPLTPLKDPLSLADRLRAADVSEAEEREIIEWIKKVKPNVQLPRAYLRTVVDNGDLADLLAEWRQAARASKTHVSELPAWCGRCGLDTQPMEDGRPAAAVNARLRFVGTVGAGGEPCPECHPACVAAS